MNSFAHTASTWARYTGIASLCAFFLASCGGGGPESPSNPPQSPTANATLSFNEVVAATSSQTTTYEATTKLLDYGARAHLTDVGSVPAAPGQGTWMMVIDDFSTLLSSTTTLPSILRTIKAQTSSERLFATYSVSYQMSTPISHGELVSNIAGGYSSAATKTLKLTVPSTNLADLVSCTLSFEAKQLACPSAFHANAPDSTLTATLDVLSIPGVASEATMMRSQVNLSNSQSALTTVADIQGHFRNGAVSSLINVINLSLGSTIPSSGKSAAEVIAAISPYPLASTIDAVITVAAGNSSQPCNDTDLNGCNAVAVSMVSQNETKDSTIVVGALTGTGSAQKIADYSTRAGYLANWYILASGDTGFYNNARGTSFAAPRVAGVAAIIKQKFPALTSQQIAQIILLSADKDMNNDGTPDFIGVDPIFGHGKLSLKNALALAATY